MGNDPGHFDHPRSAPPWHEAMQGLPNQRDGR